MAACPGVLVRRPSAVPAVPVVPVLLERVEL